MEVYKLNPILLSALCPRRKIWVVLLVLGITTVAASFVFATEKDTHYHELIMSVGGWLLTLAGILYAGNQAARIALTDAFSKLHDEEASTEQYNAKKLVFAFGRKVLSEPNRYLAAYILVESYSEKEKLELHEARRRIKHYWLLAEAYFESGLMTSSEVFAIAGSPAEILLSLEPLEVLAAEGSGSPMRQGTWTSLKLLKEWYKIQKMTEEAKNATTNIPLDASLYDEYQEEKKKRH